MGERSVDFRAKPHEDAVLGHIHVGGFIVEKVDAGRTKVIRIYRYRPKRLDSGICQECH